MISSPTELSSSNTNNKKKNIEAALRKKINIKTRELIKKCSLAFYVRILSLYNITLHTSSSLYRNNNRGGSRESRRMCCCVKESGGERGQGGNVRL